MDRDEQQEWPSSPVELMDFGLRALLVIVVVGALGVLLLSIERVAS